MRSFRAWEVVEWSCNKRKGGWVMWTDRKSIEFEMVEGMTNGLMSYKLLK